MIPIYICDDNEDEKKHLRKIVDDLCLIQGYDMRVALAATTPEAILEHRQTHTNRSVYILDVDLQHATHNGFTLAKRLRELDARGFIIFVTTYGEMMYETFKYRLEAMDFLIKEEPGLLMARLKECLHEINRLAAGDKNDRQNYFTVKTDGCVFHVPAEEILYFETTGEIHRVTLHTKERILTFRGDLSTLEKDIGSGFLRVHRACLVKAVKIKQVDYNGGTLIMEDGAVRPFSRKGKRLLKDYFEKQGLS